MNVTSLPIIEHPGHDFSLANIQDRYVMISGGKHGTETEALVSAKVTFLDVYSGKVTSKPELLQARCRHSSCASDEFAFVFVG